MSRRVAVALVSIKPQPVAPPEAARCARERSDKPYAAPHSPASHGGETGHAKLYQAREPGNRSGGLAVNVKGHEKRRKEHPGVRYHHRPSV